MEENILNIFNELIIASSIIAILFLLFSYIRKIPCYIEYIILKNIIDTEGKYKLYLPCRVLMNGTYISVEYVKNSIERACCTWNGKGLVTLEVGEEVCVS